MLNAVQLNTSLDRPGLRGLLVVSLGYSAIRWTLYSSLLRPRDRLAGCGTTPPTEAAAPINAPAIAQSFALCNFKANQFLGGVEANSCLIAVSSRHSWRICARDRMRTSSKFSRSDCLSAEKVRVNPGSSAYRPVKSSPKCWTSRPERARWWPREERGFLLD